ncbi:hypothetical protein L2E82_20028 [Cichorium intybus]|uniref:Uncharacterized protein n=1 Tax=Cichorium intybus TaxID=13427 RepID=A0ACB9DSI7_CICIN|nr:hypothetical protein L2E82_20028 [Cichorium intybus]
MAPKKAKHEFAVKNIKMKKDSKMKTKKKKTPSSLSIVVAVGGSENRGVDSDWWNSFWEKNSSVPGSTVPSDEEEGFKLARY